MSAVTEPMPTAAASPQGRSKGVIWTGVALGTALAILAMMNGAVLKIGGMPSWLGWITGGLLVWLIVVGLSVLVAEMIRRHHRQVGRAAARTGARAARRAGRAAQYHGRRGVAAAHGWAGSRWARRQAPAGDGNVLVSDDGDGPARQVRQQPEWRPRWPRWKGLRPGRSTGDAPDAQDDGLPGPDGAGDQPDGPAPRPAGTPDGPDSPDSPGPAGTGDGDGDGEAKPRIPYDGLQAPPWILQVRSLSGRNFDPWGSGGSVSAVTVYDPEDLRRRLAAAKADPDLQARWGSVKNFPVDDPWLMCVACNKHSRDLIRVPGDDRPDPHAHYIHRACLDNRNAKEHEGDTDMPQPAQPARAGGVQHAARAAASGADLAAAWKALISDTTDFDPADDAELLAWMDSESGGMGQYADSIQDVYETAVESVGLDPVAMQALHEYADAAANAAGMMQAARQRFDDHYREVREFAASGGVLPHDGRWITGEGD